MEGWSRGQYWDETGVPWVMPSPNMPTLDTAIVYPGTVLFEGTMLSEGRGTTRPFELVGAPWSRRRTRSPTRMNALGAGRRVLPAGGVRADVPEACEDAVRRLPDPRHRAHAVPARRGGRGADRASSAAWRRIGSPGVSRRTNTSTTRCRSTSSPARRRCASRSTRRCPWPTSSPAGATRRAAFRKLREPFLLY